MPIPAPPLHMSKAKHNANTNIDIDNINDKGVGEGLGVTSGSGIDGNSKAINNLHSTLPSASSKRRSFLPQLGLGHGHARYTSRSQIGGIARAAEGIGSGVTVGIGEGEGSLGREGKDLNLGDVGDVGKDEKERAVAMQKDTNIQTTTPGRLRPRSVYQIATVVTEKNEGEEVGGIAPQRKMRAPSAVSKPSERSVGEDETVTTRPMRAPSVVSKISDTQTVGLRRSQSLRKPAASTQTTQSTGTTGHSRTQSINTAMSARRDMAKGKVSSERPKSLLVAPSTSSKTSNAPADTASVGVRSSARLAAASRSASSRRPESLIDGGNSGTAQGADDPLISQPKRREPVREDPKRTTRPAFSTLQQHFTPRKVGKAPTATFLHPAPAPAANSLPPEIVNLQSEILQLHLLHESSAQTSKRWEQSAKRSLHKKFEEVASLYQAMVEHERTGQEQKNLKSLLEWSAGSASTGLIEHIQILSGPLHELPSLVEPGGRVQRLVSDFDHWIIWVQEVRSARKDSLGNEGGIGSIEGLGDSWKAETAALIRKLTSFARDLEKLDHPSPGSSIACLVDTCISLLGGILDELRVMQSIEAEVVSREKEWVEDRLKAIARDIGAYMMDSSEELAPWQS